MPSAIEPSPNALSALPIVTAPSPVADWPRPSATAPPAAVPLLAVVPPEPIATFWPVAPLVTPEPCAIPNAPLTTAPLPSAIPDVAAATTLAALPTAIAFGAALVDETPSATAPAPDDVAVVPSATALLPLAVDAEPIASALVLLATVAAVAPPIAIEKLPEVLVLSVAALPRRIAPVPTVLPPPRPRLPLLTYNSPPSVSEFEPTPLDGP
ncbi:DNA-directed RNA polymerase II [Paraburkholderia flava]|uniref:DNA-directed RNA polymerase II n=1 Tax=Paraburkholderia flava TaxID=2547393 RepID=UPI0030B8E786